MVLAISRITVRNSPPRRPLLRPLINILEISVVENAEIVMKYQKYCNALNSAFAADVAPEPKLAIALNIIGHNAKKSVQIKDCKSPLMSSAPLFQFS